MIIITNNFVGHKNWIDTCDVRIQLYWECTNSMLPSIVLESICIQRTFIRFLKDLKTLKTKLNFSVKCPS